MIPVQVNMTVAENNQQFDLTVAAAAVPPAYDGPYNVTPSEEAQTLETASKKMTQDVSIEAVPSDYVGSSVPRRSSSNMSASGRTVTAPAGYYADSASKTVAQGSVTIPTPTFSTSYANATINDSTGAIQVQTAAYATLKPTVSAGYVSSVAQKTITATVSGTGGQVTTVPGATITPTESQQTAVATHRWTTGAIVVGAIPSDYIGSAVPRKAADDISVSGSTVTIPAGYYANPVTIQV